MDLWCDILMCHRAVGVKGAIIFVERPTSPTRNQESHCESIS